MRWLAVWLFLTAAWVAGWAASEATQAGFGRSWRFTRETALHLIAVPLGQVAALWGVAKFRRMFNRAPTPPPPPP